MTFTTFRQFCEVQDATVVHSPNQNSGFVDANRRSFEQVVDPLITQFVQNLTANIMSDNNVQLQPAQVNYIVTKLKSSLEQSHYNANNDLSKSISNLWKKGNSATTAHNKADQTPLHQSISSLFNRR